MAPGILQLSVGTPAELSLARHAVKARLLGWGCGYLDDALLVFSELVTNAVKHAGSAELVQVRLDQPAVTVLVEDASPSSPQMQPEGDASGGFGLRIVDQLATEWGWEQTDTGKRVWAKMRCFD
jgi:anti-sigma regulatory factor (Ser/Thr protein kinase)